MSFDLDTLEALRRQHPAWLRDLSRLNDDECRLYDDLRWQRLRDEPLRLEQERIGFGWVEQAVAALTG